jgi:hypothetical protein
LQEGVQNDGARGMAGAAEAHMQSSVLRQLLLVGLIGGCASSVVAPRKIAPPRAEPHQANRLDDDHKKAKKAKSDNHDDHKDGHP